jgi:hypothetical protein
MKVRIECKIDSTFHREEIECDSYFIKEGAYIFLGKKGFDTYEYENVIRTYPVMFTIIKRID